MTDDDRKEGDPIQAAATEARAPEPIDRRRALALGGGLAAAATLLGSVAQRMATAAEPGRLPPAEGTSGRPVRWGMAIDLDRCTGCGGCVIACRVENNVPIAGPAQNSLDRSIFWMDLLRESEGEFPDIRTQIIPTPCNHCNNAPCVKVCPVGATFINEEGIVAQIWARCIGCRFCTVACPYTRRYFNWEEATFTDEERSRLNPDVATRPVGVVEKCTFCHHRIRQVRETAREQNRRITDAEVRQLPACAQSCPASAIVFGDLADPEAEVSRLARSARASRLQEELGTEPKVYYLRKEKW